MVGEKSPTIVDEATEIIASCQEDNKALWARDAIWAILEEAQYLAGGNSWMVSLRFQPFATIPADADAYF